MTDSTNSEPEIPSEISEAANAATNQILPPKSKQLYDSTYKNLQNWKKVKNINEALFSETVLLAYFFKIIKII